MKKLRNVILFTALGALSCWAARRVVVHQVQLVSPMGTDTGHIIASDNNLVFVDDVNPDMSFTLPKSEITRLNLDNGIVTIVMSQPFADMYGNRSDVVMRFRDPSDSEAIANWAGLPMTGATIITGGRSRTALVPITVSEYDVRHDDDNGRLIVGPDRIEWQDLRNTSKSRSWSYSEIKEFRRDGSNELKLKPYSGDSFSFKMQGRMMADDIYNAIADHIVAAHR